MADKLSMQEILAKLEEAINSADPAVLEELKEDYGDDLNSILNGMDEYTDIELEDFKHIDTDCVAGDGSEAYKVFEYTPTGQTVGFTGWYHSHEGYEWNSDKLKEMETFTVTHYKAVK